MDGSGEQERSRGLSRRERRQFLEGLRPRAAVVHEIIREEGEEELSRTVSGLCWSGLAAGLSMGFSLVTEGFLRSGLPDAPWRPLVESLGYTVGFLIVVLGRQQLFTENTITSVIPLLSRRSRECFIGVVRIWTLVLIANLAGATIFAGIIVNSDIFTAETHAAFRSISEHAMEGDFGTLFTKALFAGWLIALMVWLLPASGSARPLVILLITYVVALGGFAHIIAGSVEGLYLVFGGVVSVGDFFLGFFTPVLLGNIVGGTALVAIVNHAQVRDEVEEPVDLEEAEQEQDAKHRIAAGD